MLTTDQKETILRRAGVAVPAFPSPGCADQQHQADCEPSAARRWARTIETLFVEYSAARAAKSLRDAEETRQLGALRRASDRSTA
ncbi:MAG: hypothetical protein ABJA77_06945 [Variovorax sp.]